MLATPAPHPAPRPARSAAWRLTFATMLALAMGSGTFAGYAFGVLAPDLVREFDVSRTELGLLTAAFFLVGGGLSRAAGRATDRFGARRVMLVAFGVAAAATLGMALAPAYPAMLAAAGLAGIALSTGNPVTNKLVAEHLPPGRRGLVMGGKQAGVQVGAFLAGAALAPLAAAIGWRAALGWSVAIPLGCIVATWLVIPSDPVRGRHPDGASPSVLPSGVRWLAAYAFLMGSGVAAVNAYAPLYLVERGAASQELAGTVVATIGLVGIGSRMIWGWASERMASFAGPLLVLGGLAAVAVAMFLAVERVGLWIAWPAAAVFGASAVTWNAVGMLAVITASGREQAGRATGVVTSAFYIGFVLSPVVFGWLVDRSGGYAPAWLLVVVTYLGATLLIAGWRRSGGAEGARLVREEVG
ncbi:MAG TPA: MFS transporter [Candidatus Limnocylindria bacterium]